MTTEELKVLNQILEKVNSISTINMWPPLISAGAVILVALFQFVILKWVLSNDLKKISFQLQSAKEIKAKEDWSNNYRSLIAEFLLATDPAFRSNWDRKNITLLTYQIQLLINRKEALGSEINNLLNQIALNSVGALNIEDKKIYELHSSLFDRSQELIKTVYPN